MSNDLPRQFTYPFCYTPHPLTVEAASALISRIDADDALRSTFGEGKMMGVLLVRDGEGTRPLYGFSGLAAGRSTVEGFVPPIFDYTAPDGYFRMEEAAISATEDKVERRERSRSLQKWLFDNYVVLNARGERRSVSDIFADRGLVPPGGTGDCAAPKLLQYAYLHSLQPVAMGEFWYGASPVSEVRQSGSFYPSCLGKCGPLLEFMLQGLDVEQNPLERDLMVYEPRVVYQDDDIVVVDKPSGMLSVPGKADRKSLQEWLSDRYGREAHSCHRLDMDTSGLMVYAFSLQAKVALEGQFARREVSKAYTARLTAGKGKSIPQSGTISLPLALDYYDRPRQMVDFAGGKPAVTDFELLQMLPDGGAIVRLVPHTGRTHQLRVHCAHPLGLAHPIKGDRLYGDCCGGELCLRATSLSFAHPADGRKMNFDTSL